MKKEKLKERLEDIKSDIEDFFDNNAEYLIKGAIAIILVVGIAIGLTFAICHALKKEAEEKWNNGICPECGGKFKLFGVSRGVHTYICEDCKHEIDCYGAMK